MLKSGPGTHSRFMGQSPGLEFTKRLTPHLTLAAQASLFRAGPFIRETQARLADDIHFVAAIATYRF